MSIECINFGKVPESQRIICFVQNKMASRLLD